MAATASKQRGQKQQLNQQSVKSVWREHFRRRAEADRKRREAQKLKRD